MKHKKWLLSLKLRELFKSKCEGCILKALRFNQSGSLENLFFENRQIPNLDSDECLVQIKAARLNKNDLSNVMGRLPYTTLPRTPGRDYAGIVVQGPTQYIGNEVWGTGNQNGFTQDGSHAEYIKIKINALASKPNNLTFVQAANCGTPYMTAWPAIENCGLKPSNSILVIGAAGAVGQAAVELAKMKRATVYAAVRRKEHQEYFAHQGVSSVLLADKMSEPGYLKQCVQEHFNRPLDVIFDTTGHWIAQSVQAIGKFGKIAVIVAPGNGQVEISIRDLYRNGASIVGVNSLLYSAEESAMALNTLREKFEAGELNPHTDITSHPFDRAIEVYQELNQGLTGKHVFVM